MPERSSDPRPTIVGPPDGPESPFPIHLSGPVVQGFGRGSADLGIPTANIPIAGLSVGGHADMESGIYYGWCGLNVDSEGEQVASQGTVFEMVMSIGWNPFYGNSKRSVEIHVMHDFKHSFYGARMNLAILGFIRPEYDYVSKEKLIEDIRFDIEVARRSLARPRYVDLKAEPYLLQFAGAGHEGELAS